MYVFKELSRWAGGFALAATLGWELFCPPLSVKIYISGSQQFLRRPLFSVNITWMLCSLVFKKASVHFLGILTCLMRWMPLCLGEWWKCHGSHSDVTNITRRGVRDKAWKHCFIIGMIAACLNILYNMFITTFGIRMPLMAEMHMYFYTLAYVPF